MISQVVWNASTNHTPLANTEMMRDLIIKSTCVPVLAHVVKGRSLAALVGYLSCSVFTKSGLPYNSFWENMPSLIRMFRAFATLTKAPWVSEAKYNSTSLTFATSLPNFRKLSGAFGFALYVRKSYYAWMFLPTQMSSGCAVGANLVVN